MLLNLTAAPDVEYPPLPANDEAQDTFAAGFSYRAQQVDPPEGIEDVDIAQRVVDWFSRRMARDFTSLADQRYVDLMTRATAKNNAALWQAYAEKWYWAEFSTWYDAYVAAEKRTRRGEMVALSLFLHFFVCLQYINFWVEYVCAQYSFESTGVRSGFSGLFCAQLLEYLTFVSLYVLGYQVMLLCLAD